MKIFAIIFSAIAIASAAGVFFPNTKSDPLFEANVKALMESETQPGKNYNLCYSESVVRLGYTYYDCGKCEKVYDEKGKGAMSKCFK